MSGGKNIKGEKHTYAEIVRGKNNITGQMKRVRFRKTR